MACILPDATCENAGRDGLRPLPRARADQAHGQGIRRGRGRTGGGGARPDEVLPVRDRGEAGQADPDGDPVPGGVRRRRRRHPRLRARGRGAHADRLLGGDHPVRAHLAWNPAAVPVRQRGAEARVDAAAVLGRAAGGGRGGPARGGGGGGGEQRREGMPRLCAGERRGAFGLTEPEAGSDAGNTRTRARLVDGEWVIDGAKQFITNAGTDISGIVCITAVTGEQGVDPAHPKEISNIIVANGTAGYGQGEPYRKMGWNASDTRPLTFTDCHVPEQRDR